MDLLKNLDLTKPVTLVKLVGLGVLGLVILAFALSLIGSSFRSLQGPGMGLSFMTMPAAEPAFYGKGGVAYESDALYGMGMPELSIRNIAPMPPMPGGGTTGNDAEAYEVSDYNATVETRDLTEACVTVRKLKDLDYVIFESANESDTMCTFGFKVTHAHVEEVLAYINNLDPKDLSENTYTIKNQVEDFTSETEILKKKLASIDATLAGALDAYDDITALATNTKDVESLAKIIDSKIQIIERLTTARLSVNEQLDRLARAKAQALDRLDYSYFSVTVYENKYLDGKGIRDSWKAAVQKFVADLNRALQDATVGLFGFLVSLIPLVIYFVVLLVAAKYGWKFVRQVWNR